MSFVRKLTISPEPFSTANPFQIETSVQPIFAAPACHRVVISRGSGGGSINGLNIRDIQGMRVSREDNRAVCCQSCDTNAH